jgi:carbonic anhydrase
MSDKYYQSPIILEPFNYIKIQQYIHHSGINEDAHYNKDTRNFEVKSHVYINMNSKTYKLDEYHFHIPSEHIVNGETHEAEIHYVFIEHTEDDHPIKNSILKLPITRKKIHSNICNCCESSDFGNQCYNDLNRDIVVIGRTIHNNCISKRSKQKLKNMQVRIPHTFYQYDGTLTTGAFLPVRWLIGANPIFLDIEQVAVVAKPARPIQDLNSRIILFSKSK